MRKARTNNFIVQCQENLLIKSSVEANHLDIKARGNIEITKRLGVPAFGNIETETGSVYIGALYGPTEHVGDILAEHDETLKKLRNHSINVTSHSKEPIEIGSSHGLLNINATNSHIGLKDISNLALYVRLILN